MEPERAEARIEAVHQVESYLLALGRRDDFAFGGIEGALIAGRIPKTVKRVSDLLCNWELVHAS